MRKILLGIVLITNFYFAKAQTDLKFDSITDYQLKTQFPVNRLLRVEYTQSGKSDFESKLFKEEFQSGDLTSTKLFDVAASVPLFFKNKVLVSTSLRYVHTEYSFDSLITLPLPAPQYFQPNQLNTNHYSAAANVTWFSKSFNKPIVYNGSVIFDGNDDGFQRVKGVLSFTYILIKNETTQFQLGVTGLINRSVSIPIFPTAIYNRKLGNGFEFDLNIPRFLYLRKSVFEKGRISVGSSLAANSLYVPLNAPILPTIAEYYQFNLLSGLQYEHLITKSLILTADAGIKHLLGARGVDKGDRSRDYFYKNKQSAAGYFHVGISYSPTLNSKGKIEF